MDIETRVQQPAIDYTTSRDGRIGVLEYKKAIGYLKDLRDAMLKARGCDEESAIEGARARFLDTLPFQDRLQAKREVRWNEHVVTVRFEDIGKCDFD